MKLKKDFIVHETNKETMLVATGKANFSGMVKGNKILGEILTLLKNDTTEAEIVSKMRAKFDAPEGKIEADVHKVITELKKIGAIEGK
ncbi:PqqD family protein [Ruminococcus sp.]|uniref:PqqD family protein n=1 Tax=Ruminococcus sp. TaxID=41978 RepID=UPI0025FD8973|nr:PqqD family protein [Ruminococcus sp.]MBQ8967152.1 PqqD family protein [Ruminococcus sp.]